MECKEITSEYKPLIGKKLVDVELSDNRETLILNFENGKKAFLDTEADCCSSTWIESADNVEALYYATILNIEDIDMPEKGNGATLNRPRVDCVAFYGLRITTDKGICVIDYRNDSNGYYGGSIYLRK